MSKASVVVVLTLFLGVGSGLVAAACYAVFNEDPYEQEPAVVFMLVGAVMTVVWGVVLAYFVFLRRRSPTGAETGSTRFREET